MEAETRMRELLTPLHDDLFAHILTLTPDDDDDGGGGDGGGDASVAGSEGAPNNGLRLLLDLRADLLRAVRHLGKGQGSGSCDGAVVVSDNGWSEA